MKNKKDKDNVKKVGEKIYTNLEILKIRRYDEEKKCFEMDDCSSLDLLEIIPRDRDNASDDDVRLDMYRMMRFYRLFSSDIKILSLNFPISTSGQQDALRRAIKATSSPVRIKWMEREIEELILLDENIQRREYYLMYFANNEDTFERNRSDLLTLVGTGKNKLVREMGKGKKIQVVRKLNNMNMLIIPGEFEEDSDEKYE